MRFFFCCFCFMMKTASRGSATSSTSRQRHSIKKSFSVSINKSGALTLSLFLCALLLIPPIIMSPAIKVHSRVEANFCAQIAFFRARENRLYCSATTTTTSTSEKRQSSREERSSSRRMCQKLFKRFLIP